MVTSTRKLLLRRPFLRGGWRIEKAGLKQEHAAPLARRHPGHICVVLRIAKSVDAIADRSGKSDEYFGKIFAGDAFYGIAAQMLEGPVTRGGSVMRTRNGMSREGKFERARDENQARFGALFVIKIEAG